MMSDEVIAIVDNSKVKIVSGTRCASDWCKYHGCAFPDCAETSEEFETLEKAKEKHPNIRIV